MVARLLGEGAHCEGAQEGGDLAKLAILRLKLSRKVVSLHDRRVLELHLPLGPLLPSLPGVHHRIAIYLLVFPQEVRHVFHSNQLLQMLQEHGIVHIPIVVLFSQLFILFRSSQFLLRSLVYQRSDLVVPGQNRKLQSGQAIGSHKFIISSMFQQITHNPDMVSLDCSHQRGLPVVGGLVDSRSALLHEECGGLEVPIVGSPEERTHLRLLSQFVVQQIRSFLQKLLDVAVFLSVDVVEQVFTV